MPVDSKEATTGMMDLLGHDEEIWDLFTRKEEYEKGDRDQYGRFSYYLSRHRDVFVPRVSKMLIEAGCCCEYPESQPFAICLTHDIDAVYRPLYVKGAEIAKALRERDLLRAKQIGMQLRSSRLPAWNFKEIADIEESYEARSTFYLLALERGIPEHAYMIEDLEHEISALHDGGWEIGLHGGCRAYRDLERLQNEKRHLETVLGRTITGYRNHYLRFQVPKTWELLEQAGFQYDTTLGYTDCIGFRNGMCHPFQPFNLNKGREMAILEIPLAVMDRTLLMHMRLNPEQAWDQMKRLFDMAEQYHGVITILWHNEFMTGVPLQLYRRILEYGRQKGAWMTGGHEIATWWKKNGMKVPAMP